MIQNETKKMQQESLEELMAQFRELETASKPEGGSEHHLPLSSSPRQIPSAYSAGAVCPSFPFSWKNRTTWYPYLVLLGGLFLFVVILTAVFRPAFLYSSEQTFLWKRFFLTLFFTYVFLLGTLYGLYYYASRL